MADSKLSEMISSSIESIRTIADSSTVVGEPITTCNGTVIIPVSKVSVGFASGGLDYLPKGVKEQAEKSGKTLSSSSSCFGGGGGTGVSVTPVCFIVVKENGEATILNVANPSTVPTAVGVIDSVSSFVDKAPDLISRFKDVLGKKNNEPVRDLDDEILEHELEGNI